MFDVGTKETLCTRCAHREVCTYKQDYLDILKAVDNATVTRDTPDGKIASKNLKKIFRISDEKSLYATNADALIIRNARKRFVKPGNTTNRKINRLCKS